MSTVPDSLPEVIRIKIWRFREDMLRGGDIVSDDFFSSLGLGFKEKLIEADAKYEEHLKKIHDEYGLSMNEEYVWTLPEPAILTLSRDELEKESKIVLDVLLRGPINLRYCDKLYRLVLEYPCG
ncbi:MAG: hypothetical protein ABDH32_00015 [Candidatus Caldarchaeales archaeon]